MRATIVTRVELEFEASSGPFGDEWKLGAVHKDGMESARTALAKLTEAARAAGIRVAVIRLSDSYRIHFEPEVKS